MRFHILPIAAILAVVSAETFDVLVPPKGGDGICSAKNVTALSFTVTAAAPGLTAVLAANKPAFEALKNANLSDPSSATLPAPLLDMSCTQPNTTTCQKTFPTNRKLRSQLMCILLKNDNDAPVQSKIDVTFTFDENNGTGGAGPPGSSPSSAGETAQIAGWLGLVTGIIITTNSS